MTEQQARQRGVEPATADRPARYLSPEDVDEHRLVHAVWELTLACNLKCRHCGSRAGKRRPNELSTKECLEVVTQLAEIGAREVTLIGGEAYLRRDWLIIIRSIVEAGMLCTLQTGARNFTEDRVRQAAEAGLRGAGVSIDGLRELHDHLRGVPGSFDEAVTALHTLRAHGIVTSVNTQITAMVMPELRSLMNLFIEAGVRNWQVQLTVAMGRAADNDEILMQPYQVLELMPLLADLYREGLWRGLLVQPGNNIGYFGPYESVLRGRGGSFHWTGCSAGRNVIGIEADGTVKGCPSLPTVSYAGGNVRSSSLKEIWRKAPEMSFARRPGEERLWGFCRTCYYASVCHGGCTWTSHSLLGRPGNNPYCHHRALQLARHGFRERVSRVARAPGRSFDHGQFELVLEEIPPDDAISKYAPRHAGLCALKETESANTPQRDIDAAHASQDPLAIQRSKDNAITYSSRVPMLELCPNCNCHVFPGTRTCPHCGADVHDLVDGRRRELAIGWNATQVLLTKLKSRLPSFAGPV
jgi:radical SAM protein with 4Fe4S-binding SPASM domain